VGPYSIGLIKHFTESFNGGIIMMILALLTAAALALTMRPGHAGESAGSSESHY
jgi:MFS-type transporter involved in bile tolerance (Atg22 family)